MTTEQEPASDVLGEPFEARTIRLEPEAGDQEVVATLVRHPTPEAGRGAMLYVHGFADYFFQTHVAEHFAGQGFEFYALDLRRYGRSLRDHQRPNFVTDLSVYNEELDAAAATIRGDGHTRLVVLAHSTGGLVASLWAHDRRGDQVLDALVLNSPWLDLAKPWIIRTVGTAKLDLAGRFFPHLKVASGLPDVYGRSLHRSLGGEWEYEVAWKPHTAFPVRAGWLRAIRRGHLRVHRGLDIAVPVLVLHSTRSKLSRRWSGTATRADTVLDVDQIARWAPKLGKDVTAVAIEDGLHDLFLSPEPVRNRALEVADDWLAERLPS